MLRRQRADCDLVVLGPLSVFVFLLSSGLKVFYFLIQDLRCAIVSLIGLHFKIKPIN